MSATKKKLDLGPATPPPPAATNGTAGEVFTLAEAAGYLRVSEADILNLIHSQNLPGRLIGKEWRFSKFALQDWLRTPSPRPSKEAVLARIGSWQNDPYLAQELREIHQRRGRPETEDKG
jgi:excisionase family DNA binding protein